jgi:hypothetical protein
MKLKYVHKKYIDTQLAQFVKPGDIRTELADPDVGQKNGYEPVEISMTAIYHYMKTKRSTIRVTKLKDLYVGIISTRKYAHQPMRIDKLTEVADNPNASNRDQVSAMKGIREEVGGAVEEAMAKSGTVIINWRQRMLDVLDKNIQESEQKEEQQVETKE